MDIPGSNNFAYIDQSAPPSEEEEEDEWEDEVSMDVIWNESYWGEHKGDEEDEDGVDKDRKDKDKEDGVEKEEEKEDEKDGKKEEKVKGCEEKEVEEREELAQVIFPENFYSGVTQPQSVDGMRIRRRTALNSVLTIPLISAFLHILLGFWLLATVLEIKSQCELKMMLAEEFNSTTTEIPVMHIVTHNNTNDLCPINQFLDSHYPSPFMELLASFLVVAGAVRGIMTAYLYHQVQTDMDRKLVIKYAIITCLIILSTLVFTGIAYNNKPNPDDLSIDEAELLNLWHRLSTIFFFCVAEVIIACIIWVPTTIIVCTDSMFERMANDLGSGNCSSIRLQNV